MHPVAQVERVGNAPVRGTQSLVHTLSWCWRRPRLTAFEVLWRWACGVPVLLLVAHTVSRIVSSVPLNRAALASMSFLDPVTAATTLAQAAALLMPPLIAAVRWLGPLAALIWVVGSALGRTAVLRRADSTLHARPGTLVLLNAFRLGALVATFGVWFAAIRLAAQLTIDRPIESGAQPELVPYCAIAIVATLTLFSVWAVGSWSLSAAPLLAMRRDLGTRQALRAAVRLGPLRSKLVEINLVMGIIKIALIVLAMVLSSCPLPFEEIATPRFLTWWYLLTTVLYLIASDFFHVVQLVAYLNLWNEMGEP